jgi:hypothetical protein
MENFINFGDSIFNICQFESLARSEDNVHVTINLKSGKSFDVRGIKEEEWKYLREKLRLPLLPKYVDLGWKCNRDFMTPILKSILDLKIWRVFERGDYDHHMHTTHERSKFFFVPIEFKIPKDNNLVELYLQEDTENSHRLITILLLGLYGAQIEEGVRSAISKEVNSLNENDYLAIENYISFSFKDMTACLILEKWIPKQNS